MTFYECVTYYDDVSINGIPFDILYSYMEQFPQIFTATGGGHISQVFRGSSNIKTQKCNLRFHYGEHKSYLSWAYDNETKEILGLPEDLHIISWESLDDMSIPEEDLDSEDLF